MIIINNNNVSSSSTVSIISSIIHVLVTSLFQVLSSMTYCSWLLHEFLTHTVIISYAADAVCVFSWSLHAR